MAPIFLLLHMGHGHCGLYALGAGCLRIPVNILCFALRAVRLLTVLSSWGFPQTSSNDTRGTLINSSEIPLENKSLRAFLVTALCTRDFQPGGQDRTTPVWGLWTVLSGPAGTPTMCTTVHG